jgi:hypothetical protein
MQLTTNRGEIVIQCNLLEWLSQLLSYYYQQQIKIDLWNKWQSLLDIEWDPPWLQLNSLFLCLCVNVLLWKKWFKTNENWWFLNTIHGHLSDFVVWTIRNIQAVVMGIQTHSIWIFHLCIRAKPILNFLRGSSNCCYWTC